MRTLSHFVTVTVAPADSSAIVLALVVSLLAATTVHVALKTLLSLSDAPVTCTWSPATKPAVTKPLPLSLMLWSDAAKLIVVAVIVTVADGCDARNCVPSGRVAMESSSLTLRLAMGVSSVVDAGGHAHAVAGPHAAREWGVHRGGGDERFRVVPGDGPVAAGVHQRGQAGGHVGAAGLAAAQRVVVVGAVDGQPPLLPGLEAVAGAGARVECADLLQPARDGRAQVGPLRDAQREAARVR